MALAGKRRASRRALTLLEVLVVMVLIGMLAVGGLHLGAQARAGVSSKLDTRKFARKLRLLRTTALAHGTPTALHLVKDGTRWRGSFVGRGVHLRPFSLGCDALLLQGKPQASLWVHADEHGEVARVAVQMVHGRIQTDLILE